MKQCLIIRGALPGLNEIIKDSRANIYMANKKKREFTELVALSCKVCNIMPVSGRSNFEFFWYCKDKRRDKDNIMAGQKFIFDGLQKAGVIKNDGWGEVGDISHKFFIDKVDPRVLVFIDCDIFV